MVVLGLQALGSRCENPQTRVLHTRSAKSEVTKKRRGRPRKTENPKLVPVDRQVAEEEEAERQKQRDKRRKRVEQAEVKEQDEKPRKITEKTKVQVQNERRRKLVEEAKAKEEEKLRKGVKEAKASEKEEKLRKRIEDAKLREKEEKPREKAEEPEEQPRTRTICVKFTDPDATDSSSDEEGENKGVRKAKVYRWKIQIPWIENNPNPSCSSREKKTDDHVHEKKQNSGICSTTEEKTRTTKAYENSDNKNGFSGAVQGLKPLAEPEGLRNCWLDIPGPIPDVEDLFKDAASLMLNFFDDLPDN